MSYSFQIRPVHQSSVAGASPQKEARDVQGCVGEAVGETKEERRGSKVGHKSRAELTSSFDAAQRWKKIDDRRSKGRLARCSGRIFSATGRGYQ